MDIAYFRYFDSPVDCERPNRYTLEASFTGADSTAEIIAMFSKALDRVMADDVQLKENERQSIEAFKAMDI